MFNYKRVTMLEGTVESERKLREEVSKLYDRLIQTKDEEITRLREEVGNQHGKISLMETILMPLSTNAGAAYQELLNPPKKQIPKAIVEPPMSDWQRYKLRKEKELEAEYQSEEKPHASSQQEAT